MTGTEFKTCRKNLGLTQQSVAAVLDVSQTYVALLESGQRPFTPRLLRAAVRRFQLSPTVLPFSGTDPQRADPERVVKDLGALGYPGFAYMRHGRMKNPAEVLLNALSLSDLESRAVEALPWLFLAFDMAEPESLVREARARAVQNRMGFVVDLALAVLVLRGEADTPKCRSLRALRDALYQAPLSNEDTFFQVDLSTAQRDWLREARSESAKQWNLLTDWKPEHLPYTQTV